MTAHLVMPGGDGDDAFLHQVAETLAARFSIDHATIQVERDAEIAATHCPLAARHAVKGEEIRAA
jgi:cobalt-zinc-cadmium efflux system protein